MTSTEFNTKYKNYLAEGHYGLDIHDERVVNYLDSIFETTLIHIPFFKYYQIKLKFNFPRFYTNLHELVNTNLSENFNTMVEKEIMKILNIQDDV